MFKTLFSVPSTEKFKIVDNWMWLNRLQEEIIQTKKEVLQYLESLATVRNELRDDVDNTGKGMLANKEMKRIQNKILETLQIFNISKKEDFERFKKSITEDVESGNEENVAVEESTNIESELSDYDSEFDNSSDDSDYSLLEEEEDEEEEVI